MWHQIFVALSNATFVLSENWQQFICDSGAMLAAICCDFQKSPPSCGIAATSNLLLARETNIALKSATKIAQKKPQLCKLFMTTVMRGENHTTSERDIPQQTYWKQLVFTCVSLQLDGQAVKYLHLLADKFELDQSERKSSQVITCTR